jgi:hypothetical protein
MVLVGERELSDLSTPNRTTTPTPSPTATASDALAGEYIHRAAWKAGLIAAINVLALILAARAIVLIAVIGGIVLAYPALDHPDLFRVGILAVYCVGVILPSVVLAIYRT